MIATNIDQSKNLVKLGLDPSTADMCYIREQWLDDETDKVEEGWSEFPVAKVDDDKEIPQPIILPSWTLSALLSLIPEVHLQQRTNSYKTYYHCTIPVYDAIGDTAIDAAYEVILFMIKYKYIKTV